MQEPADISSEAAAARDQHLVDGPGVLGGPAGPLRPAAARAPWCRPDRACLAARRGRAERQLVRDLGRYPRMMARLLRNGAHLTR